MGTARGGSKSFATTTADYKSPAGSESVIKSVDITHHRKQLNGNKYCVFLNK